jgi:hypothetical protein
MAAQVAAALGFVIRVARSLARNAYDGARIERMSVISDSLVVFESRLPEPTLSRLTWAAQSG